MRMSWISGKKLAELTAIIVITLLLLNCAAYLMLRYLFKADIYDDAAYRSFKQKLMTPKDQASIPHPYLGKLDLGGEKVASPLSDEPLFNKVYQSSNPRDVKILILGGSVALHLSTNPEADIDNLFAQRINAHFKTDRFSVYTAAINGGKQPQQYLKLVYLDLLGFRPDIVINYDGFNETALPLAENRAIHNPAIFPRSYSKHLESTTARGACIDTNNRLQSDPGSIPIVELMAYAYAKRCLSKINGDYGVPWWGEQFKRGDDEAYASQSRAIWRESSNRIYQFTKMHGIDYIHVLQPNQYVAGSKILTQQERTDALGHRSYGGPVSKYYPRLGRDGLQTEHFLDQRDIFRTNGETLYIDRCCHLNRNGMQYIADDIISRFSEMFRQRLQR